MSDLQCVETPILNSDGVLIGTRDEITLSESTVHGDITLVYGDMELRLRSAKNLSRGQPMRSIEEPYIENQRRLIEQQYVDHPTGCGGSFGELLCFELHSAGLTFKRLARKWGISLADLGDLIADHCRRLTEAPCVDHDFSGD